jgi:hypothetical protein
MRVRTSLALAFTAAVLFGAAAPNPALAQTTFKERQMNQPLTNFPVVDTCTGETVFVNGKEDFFIRVQSRPGGGINAQTRDHQQGTGVGDQTRFQYQYQDMFSTSVQSSVSTFTFRVTEREHVIRQGSPPLTKDDFFLRFLNEFRFNDGEPSITTKSIQSEQCK